MISNSKIAQRIRTDIVAGVLPFGSRLTIDQLASRYETSHMPVREALRELVGEGIVVAEPNRGARVRTIDESFVSELMNVRAGIEGHLARRAAERATSQQIEQLWAIENELEQNIEDGDYVAELAANRKLHTLINTIADSPDATIIVDRHWFLLAALWQQYGYGPDRFAGVANDHQHLILAFEAKDGKAAELIMIAHVMKSKQIMTRQMRQTITASDDTPDRSSAQPSGKSK